MAKTELVITIIIDDSTTIQKKGTLTVSRNDLAHIRAFKTTNASDTAYAIDQALRELAELERKAPAQNKSAKSKPKASPSRLDDAPVDEAVEAVSEIREEVAPADPDDPSVEPESGPTMEPDELHYDLIRVTGADQSPVAYKHAALLAESLRSQNLWDNRTPITFQNPVDAWTKLQAGTLDLQEVLSLYTGTATPAMSAPAAATNPSLTDPTPSTLL